MPLLREGIAKLIGNQTDMELVPQLLTGAKLYGVVPPHQLYA